MKSVHRGWVAGVIEGEGHIRTGGQRPHVAVEMTDEDVVRRLHTWTGLGNVQTPRMLPSGKTAWRWHVGAIDEVRTLLVELLPLFGVRRASAAQKALKALVHPKRGTAATCSYGHALTEENLRIVDGRRRCLACQARRQREYRERSIKA